MTKIVQFGEGNFLRTFVDMYFDTLNKKGLEYIFVLSLFCFMKNAFIIDFPKNFYKIYCKLFYKMIYYLWKLLL